MLGTFAFCDFREKVKRELDVWPVEANRRATGVQMLAAVMVPDA